MNFGKNLQYLRKLHKGMTQEELASKLRVTRQTISKWELNQGNPELSKIAEICTLFNCNADELLFHEINVAEEVFSEIKIEKMEAFTYTSYTVISKEPEDDAIAKMKELAKTLALEDAVIIGWDFPYLSQELINVHHLHGYTAGLVLPESDVESYQELSLEKSKTQNYVTLEIKEPMANPFYLIGNAFKAAFQYIRVNRYCYDHFAFEMQYQKNGIHYMKIWIAIVD